MAGLLFIISAPSGSGKSTLVHELRSVERNLDFSVSYTTRAPRGSEEDGREYHFVSRQQFEAMIAEDELLEYAEVFGNYYGTARSALTESFAHGRDLLLDIDVQGAVQVHQRVPEAISIFILPPTPDVLKMRLTNRSRAEGKVEDSVIERRLAKARHEIENYHKYKYVLVNDVLERAVDELSAIVKAERYLHDGDDLSRPGVQKVLAIAESCRVSRSAERLRPVLGAFGVPFSPETAQISAFPG
ncbi:MAG: guanylate kinase [Acidobacteriaceae bacterium]